MTLIVGEIGSNFESKQDIFDSITSLKECGADVAKLQLYSHKELYGYDGPEMPGEIPRAWIPEFADHCGRVGIEFMCTAFSPEGYRFIDRFVRRHKIASAENTDLDIIACVRGLGKPVLFSTGGSGPEEIKECFMALCIEGLKLIDVTPMYCVSAYPSKNVDISLVQTIRMISGVPAGYSCHTNDWVTAAHAAKYYGASIIEKHFKIREMDTPDNPHSILPEDFSRMVALAKGETFYRGDEGEADFIKYSKRRWIPELNGYYRTKKP